MPEVRSPKVKMPDEEDLFFKLFIAVTLFVVKFGFLLLLKRLKHDNHVATVKLRLVVE